LEYAKDYKQCYKDIFGRDYEDQEDEADEADEAEDQEDEETNR
jgi:hypothetical protein